MDIKTANKLLTHKDEDVRELAKEYLAVMSSPHLETYLIVKNQMSDWNQQLIIKKNETVPSPDGKSKTVKGRIDIFADSDNKDFDRAVKYFSEIVKFHEILDTLRKRMTPEEIKKSEEQVIAEDDGTGAYEKALNAAKK